MGWKRTLGTALIVPVVVGVMATAAQAGQQASAAPEVTFTKDIAPILQRSCHGQRLVTFHEVIRESGDADGGRGGVCSERDGAAQGVVIRGRGGAARDTIADRQGLGGVAAGANQLEQADGAIFRGARQNFRAERRKRPDPA